MDGRTNGREPDAPPGRKRKTGREGTEQLTTTNVTRLTVNIGPATAKALQTVAQNEGVSVTEALRRLVGYGDLLYRAVKLDNKDVLFRDGKETQQVLIP